MEHGFDAAEIAALGQHAPQIGEAAMARHEPLHRNLAGDDQLRRLVIALAALVRRGADPFLPINAISR